MHATIDELYETDDGGVYLRLSLRNAAADPAPFAVQDFTYNRIPRPVLDRDEFGRVLIDGRRVWPVAVMDGVKVQRTDLHRAALANPQPDIGDRLLERALDHIETAGVPAGDHRMRRPPARVTGPSPRMSSTAQRVGTTIADTATELNAIKSRVGRRP